MEKGTGTVNFWNTRKNFGVVNSGTNSIYLKRYHVTEPTSPAQISAGDNIQFDRSINGYEVNSTCSLKPIIKIKE